jgi:hypothetical protein
MPALFLAHGSPMNIIEQKSFTEALRRMPHSLPCPKNIVVLSAHWQTRGMKETRTARASRTPPCRCGASGWASPGGQIGITTDARVLHRIGRTKPLPAAY